MPGLPQGDQCIFLEAKSSETKFSQEPITITKKYAEDLRRKIGVFRNVSGTRKNIFLTLLTTHGITRNAYAAELVQTALTTDVLFSPDSLSGQIS